MAEKEKWKVQINDGEVQDLETVTTQYHLAAVSALAQLEYPESKIVVNNKTMDIVKIWVERLLPDYGPYFYAFDGDIVYQAIKKEDDWTFIYS